MTGYTLYAEFAQKAYAVDLEKEMNAALEKIAEATEILVKDVWHDDANRQLEANTCLFKQLRAELSKVEATDPDEWWKSVREAQA